MTNEVPIIEARGVVKDFILGEQRVRALRGVDLSIQEGEYLVVMGPSGSGKSTLLNMIGGLDRPTEGAIFVEGHDIGDLDEIGLAHYRRTHIGFVFQSFNLIPTMTAQKNVEFPMVFAGRGKAERRKRAEELLTKVGLGERIGHKPVEMSGGEQQRVAIARALANEPPIIFGDEPTGNLDTKTGRDIMTLLADLNAEGTTIIIVSHDPRVVVYADRVVHMQDGLVLREEKGGSGVGCGGSVGRAGGGAAARATSGRGLMIRQETLSIDRTLCGDQTLSGDRRCDTGVKTVSIRAGRIIMVASMLAVAAVLASANFASASEGSVRAVIAPISLDQSSSSAGAPSRALLQPPTETPTETAVPPPYSHARPPD